MELLDLQKNIIYVGRAATGIYLILKANGYSGKRVLVPANICYAAVYPILYAGAEPVFCDVDAETGNMTYGLVAEKINSVDAVIAPHMYGNPIQDMNAISGLCKANNVLLIEDCASAMGASINGKFCGTFGDYSIFSTGYSKTVDIGGGGMVMSNHELGDLEAIYQYLPERIDEYESEEAFFSKLYRLIRNNEANNIHSAIWEGLRNKLQFMFVYQDHKFDNKLISVPNILEESIMKRRSNYVLYKSKIRHLEYIYQFADGSVPWRFCMMIPEEKHRRVIDELLDYSVPVSDWYPVVTPVFGVPKEKFIGALTMENRIINFPLLIAKTEINRICDIVNRVLEMESRN